MRYCRFRRVNFLRTIRKVKTRSDRKSLTLVGMFGDELIRRF